MVWVASAPLSLAGLLAIAPGCKDDSKTPPQVKPNSEEQPGLTLAWPPTEEQTRANVQAAFARISEGKFADHVARTFSADGTFVFHGPPKVAGSYQGKAAIIQGFERVFQAVPKHKFNIQEIWVTTTRDEVTAAAVWTDDAQLPDGTLLPTHGMNRIRIGPTGVILEELFLAPDDPTRLQ